MRRTNERTCTFAATSQTREKYLHALAVWSVDAALCGCASLLQALAQGTWLIDRVHRMVHWNVADPMTNQRLRLLGSRSDQVNRNAVQDGRTDFLFRGEVKRLTGLESFGTSENGLLHGLSYSLSMHLPASTCREHGLRTPQLSTHTNTYTLMTGALPTGVGDRGPKHWCENLL